MNVEFLPTDEEHARGAGKGLEALLRFEGRKAVVEDRVGVEEIAGAAGIDGAQLVIDVGGERNRGK